MTLADQAISLARRGFFVFPCKAKGEHKKPAIKNWKALATRDETQIRAWWDGDFVGCAIGIAHGKFDDGDWYLVTFDCDNKHGKDGTAQLMGLELEHGDLPRTYTQRTQSGGLHHVYKTRHPVKGPPDFRPGLDIRGARNLIYGAGSVWNGKAYTVEIDAPVAEAPGWVVDIIGVRAPKELKELVAEGVTLDTEAQIRRAREYLETTRPAVRGEAGDERVLQVAMKVGDLGISQYECLDLMQKHFADRCTPPLEPAYLEQKVENAYASRENPLGEAAAEADFDEVPAPAEDFPVETAPEKPRQSLIFWDDEDDAPEPDPLIENVVDKGACVLIYGKPNVGKTFVTYTMARCVAAGKPFGDKPVEQGAVLYIQCEGHAGLRRRRRALRAYFKDGNIPLVFLKASVNLVKSAADRQWLADQIQAVEARTGQDVALVVIDTLSAAAPGMDENAAGEVSAALAAMKGFTCDRGITLAIIHHEGKNSSGGPRGSSAFSGNVDTVIHVTEGSIVSDKARESAKLEPLPFTLEILTVGQTQKGRPVTSCVAVVHGTAAREFGRLPMSKLEAVAYEALEQMEAEAELDGEDAKVTSSEWQNRLKSFPTGFPTEKGFKQRFYDVRNGLVGKGYVVKSLKDEYKVARSERSENKVGT